MKIASRSQTIVALCLAAVFSLGGTRAGAALIDDIARDFKPIDGVVVMKQGEEIIIDLDASSGIAPGDIFSVLGPGKQILHPKSQKVLGVLEEVKAVLKVTRLKTGFAFTRALGNADAVQRGDTIRRYSNLPALFWDYTGEGKTYFTQVQSALAELKWQDYESGQRSKPATPAQPGGRSEALIFILTKAGMEVRDPEFAVLKAYPSPAAAAKSSAIPAAPQAPEPRAAVPQPPAIAPPVAVQPVFSKAETLANLPDVALMADFIRQESRVLMASTDGRGVRVYNLTTGLSQVTEAKLPRPGTILALKWWQPSTSEPLYLAVTAWIDNTVRSSIWSLQKDVLQIARDDIPRILGAFDVDRDGRPETLLAQEFDRESFFSQRVSEAVFTNQDLRYSAPKVSLPRQFTVLGSAITDVDGDGRPESIFIRNQMLFVYSGSRQMYKSPKEMGGSVSVLTYNSSASSINAEPATAVFEASPLCLDLDRNGIPEIITSAAERTLVGTFVPSLPDTKRTWIAVTRYQNGRFEAGALGDKLDLPVQGLTVYEQQLLVVTTEAGGITGEGAKSHLLAFSLGL